MPWQPARLQKTPTLGMAHLVLLLEAGNLLEGARVPCNLLPLPTLTSRAYNEEGKEEKGDEDKDEEEEPARPAKCQRMSSSAPKGRGRGKAKAATPTPSAASSHFPLVDHKTRGCLNCIFRNRNCEHGKPGVLCDHCKKGHLSHCSHTFTIPEHVQAANHIELYANLSNQRGNELLLDLSTARIDYELAPPVSQWLVIALELRSASLPGMAEILEELQPLWGQLFLDSQVQLTVDYHVAIMQYPFLSDTHCTESTPDDELQQLLNILVCHAARNQQSTPPPVENSNWLEEDEAGPSGSK
ncbi:hypothetical protein B0H14DRAFT_2620370 [Mycena olivaceomarginata]|nr:hypothetical protein B0H14DRAFT_2620370 [Mycena olivaceomarginata]